MSIFDKMFKPNKFDEAMDNAFQEFVDNNPVSKRAKAKINEAADSITRTLETELYGEAKDHPDGQPSVMDDFESVSSEWDSMIDQIIDRELGQFKICPKCKESVSSELTVCPHCHTPLPEITAAFQICPHCGTKNKMLDLYCAKCGKRLDLIVDPDENDK